MISYNTLLTEIEQLVLDAKGAKDEQRLREQLSAIRALCNLALSKNDGKETFQQQQPSVIFSQTNQSFQNKSPNIQNNISSVNTKKLQEDDANGASIFDF